MATEQQTRNKGSLFENGEKRKPSQPDMKGDATLEGVAYDVSAWRREEQLTVSLAPARAAQNNTYPPEAYRGALDPAPKTMARAAAKSGAPVPAWIGDIVGDERSYAVQAFQKQGKKGPYLTLSFEPTEHQPEEQPAPE